MPCVDCELARELERHARLVASEIEAVREAERLRLTRAERIALLEEEEELERLLDRIQERQLVGAVV